MSLARRIKKGLTKMIPGDKITYVRPPEKKKKKRNAPDYKIPETPKDSGIGFGS